MYALTFRSAFRANKVSVLSSTMIAGNAEPAFGAAYVKWFSTAKQAEKYAGTYLLPGEKPEVVTKEQVLKNAEVYF